MVWHLHPLPQRGILVFFTKQRSVPASSSARADVAPGSPSPARLPVHPSTHPPEPSKSRFFSTPPLPLRQRIVSTSRMDM